MTGRPGHDRDGRGARRIGPGLALAAIVGLSACGDPSGTPTDAGAAVRRTARQGGVALEVELSGDRATVGEPLTLVVDVSAPEGVEIRMPEPAEELGPFRVIDAKRPPGVPGEQGRRWRHTYELETYESGDLELPAVSVAYLDRRGDDAEGTAPAELSLAVEPISVRVESVLDATAEPELRDIRGFRELPAARPWWFWPAVATVAAFLAALVTTAILRRRRRGAGDGAAPAPVVPPHVWARDALDRLEAEQLPDRGEVHAFFFRLSDVVRGYIERRFAIDAPDRTTEEFIREMRDHPRLAEEHQRLLGGFLRSADMVKFALHRPPLEQCGRAMATARRFVDETTPAGAGDDPGREAAA
jgi:hypothetical protein